MRYLSVCSGIEAASAAWHDLGFVPVVFSEIEKFPCAVLSHLYPQVPNLGDMTKFKEWPNYEIDLLVGGTPCQSFSVAGLRKGLEDPRGNLMLTFLGIADKYKPQWIVWENVPGVLSSGKGRDFGTFLGSLAKLGYGWAYRVLDAQYFGVPQRRRRVFVVGCLGNWKRAAKVLFEPESLSRNSTTSRETGKDVTEIAGTLASSGGGLNRPAGNANELDFCVISPSLRARANSSHRADSEAYIPDVSGAVCAREGKGPNSGLDQGTPLICQTNQAKARRLTPRECERLQGFPDDYTLVPWKSAEAPDGLRYKAIGNSMAVPVMRWIGKRIAFQEVIS